MWGTKTAIVMLIILYGGMLVMVGGMAAMTYDLFESEPAAIAVGVVGVFWIVYTFFNGFRDDKRRRERKAAEMSAKTEAEANGVDDAK